MVVLCEQEGSTLLIPFLGYVTFFELGFQGRETGLKLGVVHGGVFGVFGVLGVCVVMCGDPYTVQWRCIPKM